MALLGGHSTGLAAAVSKARVGPGLLEPQPGVTLLFDYGSFQLFRITDEALANLPDEVRRELIFDDEMDLLRLDAHPFNPLEELPQIPPSLQADPATGPTLHLVQFVGPLTEQWLDIVRGTGAIPLHYLASNGYLVWADPISQAQLDRLAQERDVLQFSGPYHPYYKLSMGLRDLAQASVLSTEAIEVTIQLYGHSGVEEALVEIERLSTEPVDRWRPVLDYRNTSARISIEDLVLLARRPEVVWIEEAGRPEPFDEVQAQIVAGALDATLTGPSGPGYLAWLSATGFSSTAEDYPIVDLIDFGIGSGSVVAGDATFHRLGLTSQPTRVQYVQRCHPGGDGGDTSGHGHIDASIAFGYDNRTGFPFQDPDLFRRGLGVNPFGRLAATQVFDPNDDFDLSLCSGGSLDYAGLLDSVYSAGARIANASWGDSVSPPGRYSIAAQAFDAATRDARPSSAGNQELALVVAAGNFGPSAESIATPALAKNVVAVGASESFRPTFSCGPWGPEHADNAMDIALFSSRGPSGTRVKPELVAPGTHIHGTASTNDLYDGHRVCGQYIPSGQTVFTASLGTSQAAPAVAGAASLVHYWLANHYGSSLPSPAMLKAYLLAHTTYLTGIDAADTLPSNHQGFGMPNLATAFDDTPRRLVDQSQILDNTGESFELDGVISDLSREVRVVLVYTDKPGPTQVTNPEVNDLDLEVVVDGVLYRGNRFQGPWSVAGGTADGANNYEAVYLPRGTSGAIEVTVRGSHIADDGVPGSGDGTDQDFALVCYNCVLDLSHVWVDFSHPGPGNGTFDEPFDTLAAGIAAVTPGGLISIKAGSSTETPRITKAMTIEAFGGTVRIGG